MHVYIISKLLLHVKGDILKWCKLNQHAFEFSQTFYNLGFTGSKLYKTWNLAQLAFTFSPVKSNTSALTVTPILSLYNSS